jgi:hypothetical protein
MTRYHEVHKKSPNDRPDEKRLLEKEHEGEFKKDKFTPAPKVKAQIKTPAKKK